MIQFRKHVVSILGLLMLVLSTTAIAADKPNILIIGA